MDRFSIRVEPLMSQLEMLMGAAGVGGGVAANWIDDVFSTYLYTGNNTSQTIANNIDLSNKGGLVWLKSRSAAYNNILQDTVRGATSSLKSNNTDAAETISTRITGFLSNGFSIGSNANVNASGETYCSWTFAEQEKFFDVVTYSGDGSAPRAISHNLGSTPGMVIIKKTSATGDWLVYHRSSPGNLYLNYADAADSGTNPFLSAVSSTTFTLSTNQNATTNANGATYVAYLFAHNAGGFGAAGTDNVISCGSYSGTGATQTISLGYEAQYVMIKNTSSASQWTVLDVMRGMSLTGNTPVLYPNDAAAEDGLIGTGNFVNATATGFIVNGASGAFNSSGNTFIYMAIRRPMKPPTSGTQVFSTDITASASTSSTPTYSSGFVTDMGIEALRTGSSFNFLTSDRLRGQQALYTNRTDAEAANTNVKFDYMNGWGGWSSRSSDYMSWMFKRATGFMDVVCFTGSGTARTVAHNLGVAPELMIVKKRNASASWQVYTAPTGNTLKLILEENGPTEGGSTSWNSTTPTASVFSLGTDSRVNGSGDTFVNYLFASATGISKVGSYTGTGATQTINCGFTGGARFVLIKRTDATGDWYVYDTARGMTLLTDPYLLLNSTAAESATLGSVTTTTGGFTVDATILAAINTNAASYIFLAIA